MSSRWRWAEILRPLMRRLPRGAGLFWRALRGSDDLAWQDMVDPIRVFHDNWLQAYVYADLRHWSGRSFYLLGKYYDRPHQLLQKRLLRHGDTYLDLGANIGIHTIGASRQVGSSGRVFSFEPNPHVGRLLKAHVAINSLDNVRVADIALSDEPGELQLSAPDAGSGMLNWSLRQIDDAAAALTVPVRRGDDVLSPTDIHGRLLIKIDTEGYELHALRGIPGLLAHADCFVTIEVTPRWLEQTGGSAATLFDFMQSHNYQPWFPAVTTNWLGQERLELAPMTSAVATKQYDVLFARPGCTF